MNLQTMNEKLNTEFAGSARKLVFWYDDNGEFADEIDTLTFENAKVHKLTGDNLLYTKYLLECVDTENSYLVYAPFPKPADIDNHLADMLYYSKEFYADRVSLLCVELQIPEKYKEHLAKYPKFWKSNKQVQNERAQKFAALGIEHYNTETIDVGLLAVMLNVKTPNFEEVLKTAVLKENKDGVIAEFTKMGLQDAFWQLCDRYYGYTDENPTIEKLTATLLMTYTAHSCTGEFPKVYQQFLSPKRNDISVFASNLMNNILYKERYDEIANELAGKLKLSQYIKAEKIEQYLLCDGFEIFDTLIISHMSQALVDSCAPLVDSYREIIKRRGTKCHYSYKFCGYYRALSRADKLISAIKQFGQDTTVNANDMIERYAKKWHHIDGYYRQFYFAFDRLSDTSALMDLRMLVENLYTNSFLSKLSIAWAEKLEPIEFYGRLTGEKQYEFYKSIAQPASERECTVVIISDALRFECGSELHKRFMAKAGANAELSYMLSTLPSYTRLGMAALLPHKSLSLSDSFDVLLDGGKCQSKEERTGILTAAHGAAAVFGYTEMMAMKRDAVREAVAGKDLIYIYHDQIDARGDHPSTENEVFVAADEAVGEIMALVQKLTVDRSLTSYIITADHGFLYKRDKLEECDKVNLGKIADERINKRYILSKGVAPEIEGSLTYSMEYLDKALVDYNVTVPRGVDIFKVRGGGQNYVHGGLSLQEIVIPLLRVKTERGKQNVGSVKVVLTSLTRKITNLITYLDFIQTENISDTLKSVKLKVYFESTSGERISDEEIIVADKKNASPEKRQFREKFTFKNRKYDKGEHYYLVMIDLEAGIEVERNEFQLDIAFADDFGFNV